MLPNYNLNEHDNGSDAHDFPVQYVDANPGDCIIDIHADDAEEKTTQPTSTAFTRRNTRSDTLSSIAHSISKITIDTLKLTLNLGSYGSSLATAILHPLLSASSVYVTFEPTTDSHANICQEPKAFFLSLPFSMVRLFNKTFLTAYYIAAQIQSTMAGEVLGGVAALFDIPTFSSRTSHRFTSKKQACEAALTCIQKSNFYKNMHRIDQINFDLAYPDFSKWLEQNIKKDEDDKLPSGDDLAQSIIEHITKASNRADIPNKYLERFREVLRPNVPKNTCQSILFGMEYLLKILLNSISVINSAFQNSVATTYMLGLSNPIVSASLLGANTIFSAHDVTYNRIQNLDRFTVALAKKKPQPHQIIALLLTAAASATFSYAHLCAMQFMVNNSDASKLPDPAISTLTYTTAAYEFINSLFQWYPLSEKIVSGIGNLASYLCSPRPASGMNEPLLLEEKEQHSYQAADNGSLNGTYEAPQRSL